MCDKGLLLRTQTLGILREATQQKQQGRKSMNESMRQGGGREGRRLQEVWDFATPFE